MVVATYAGVAGVAEVTVLDLAAAEVCDGVDNDGDGQIDEGLVYCLDGSPAPNTDGAHSCLDGYDDADGDVANGCETDLTVEVCDGIDNDGDGDIDEGCGPLTWEAMSSGTAEYLLSVWGTSPTDVFAVGEAGTILHYDGTTWSTQSSPTMERMWRVWGTPPADVHAVGENGTRLHYDGAIWSLQAGPTVYDTMGIWGTAPDDYFIVDETGTRVHHYQGSAWSSHLILPEHYDPLWSVHGSSSTNVYVVGDGPFIYRYDGVNWQRQYGLEGAYLWDVWVDSPTFAVAVGKTQSLDNQYVAVMEEGMWWAMSVSGSGGLLGVWGSGRTDVVAVGASGTILHFDGYGWNEETSGTTETLHGVWGIPAGPVFAVGFGGTVLRGTR